MDQDLLYAVIAVLIVVGVIVYLAIRYRQTEPPPPPQRPVIPPPPGG